MTMPSGHDTGDRIVGGGKYMRVMVSQLPNNKLQIRTHIFTHVLFAGFHGGVTVSLSDNKGNLFMISPLYVYGVDGTQIPFKQSDRWAEETLEIDADVWNKTERIDVWYGITPRNQLTKDIPLIKEIIEGAIEIYKWIKNNTNTTTSDPVDIDSPQPDGDYIADESTWHSYVKTSSHTNYIRLTSAQLYTHTNDDDKDKDTGVNVSVMNKIGVQIASISNAYNSQTDATKFADGTNHVIQLMVSPIRKEDCDGFGVRIFQNTNGNDTWKFNATVRLNFSDNSVMEKSLGGIRLVNNGASVSF